MSIKVVDGGGFGPQFDDGVYEGVKKVIVGEDSHGVVYIKIHYVENGDVVQRQHGRATEPNITESEFEVKYPDEYITWIGGTYRDDHRYDLETAWGPIDRSPPQRRSQSISAGSHYVDMTALMLKSTVSELQFKTSYGRTSHRFGGKPGNGSLEIPFQLEGRNGTKLVGLFGCSGDFLDAIGAHFALVSSVFKQLEPQGGLHGVSWDDGAYDALRKVCVGEDDGRVSSVEFHYLKGNELVTHRHGKDSKERKEFVLKCEDDEYVETVEGTINEDGFVSSLTFYTSMDRSSEEFGRPVGTKFVLEATGFDKLVGFRGRSCVDGLNALGANFAVVVAPPVKKLEAKGCDDGDEWDDGVHDNVRMITVTYSNLAVESVKFEYVNGTESVMGDAHGNVRRNHKKEEFKLYFNKGEYITSVEGHYGQKLPPFGRPWYEVVLRLDYITMLKFNTNITTYQVLQHNPDDVYEGRHFLLAEKDHKIVGFHGKSSLSLQQIGAYVKPIDDDNA